MSVRVEVLGLTCFINCSRRTCVSCAALGNCQVESGGTFGHGAKERVTSSPVSGSSQFNDMRRRHLVVPYSEAKTPEAITLLCTLEPLNQNVQLLNCNFSGSTRLL